MPGLMAIFSLVIILASLFVTEIDAMTTATLLKPDPTTTINTTKITDTAMNDMDPVLQQPPEASMTDHSVPPLQLQQQYQQLPQLQTFNNAARILNNITLTSYTVLDELESLRAQCVARWWV